MRRPRSPIRRRVAGAPRSSVERELSLAQMRLGYGAVYEDLCAVKVPRVAYGAVQGLP